VALKLGRLGIARVRPLAGGLEAWKTLGLPVVPRTRRGGSPAGA
jgi:3-mercaptopyruvate sulfurtransferase SseA